MARREGVVLAGRVAAALRVWGTPFSSAAGSGEPCRQAFLTGAADAMASLRTYERAAGSPLAVSWSRSPLPPASSSTRSPLPLPWGRSPDCTRAASSLSSQRQLSVAPPVAPRGDAIPRSRGAHSATLSRSSRDNLLTSFSARALSVHALSAQGPAAASGAKEAQGGGRRGGQEGGRGGGHECGWGALYRYSVAYASAMAAVTAASSASTVSAKQVPAKPVPQEVVLYQYEACPFCNKVKAFLDYYDIKYKVVEVNPLTRKELKWSEYKKVPVLVVDGEPLVDSSAIISSLQDRLNPDPARPPRGAAENKEEEAKWRKWVDEHLVHLLSPNIYRNPSEALEAFDYITTNGNFGAMERAAARYAGAASMYFIGKRLKKKHKIEDERESLYSALKDWTAALGTRKFLGGDKPNLADLAVFGVLRPIRNMQTGRDMMENTNVGPWYARMEAEVGATARLPEQ